MPFINKYNVGAASGGGGGVSDHGSLTGLTDNDHPQYAPSTDWTPPPFQYKDADEITVLAGRYHKGGHRLYGHYQNLTGMADYWDVAAKFDVDIDATYSAGSTSGMVGGDVNDSWYSVFMVASDELVVLPFIRVDAVDYDTSNTGKTTINPADHDDGTTANDSFVSANDIFNNYRLVKLSLDSNHGATLTIEDSADGTPDEIIIDGDQTAYISATDWFQMIPPSGTDFVDLGLIRIDSSGNIDEFAKGQSFGVYLLPQKTINGNLSTSLANTEMASAIPPNAVSMLAYFYVYGNAHQKLRIATALGESGSDPRYAFNGIYNDSNIIMANSVTFWEPLTIPAKVRNRFEAHNGTAWVAATSGAIVVYGFKI
jgi:hypothetical protein